MIGHRFGANDAEVFFVQCYINIIICALLPVLRARCARSRAVGVGRGQNGAQLLKFITVVGGGIVLDVLRSKGKSAQAENSSRKCATLIFKAMKRMRHTTISL